LQLATLSIPADRLAIFGINDTHLATAYRAAQVEEFVFGFGSAEVHWLVDTPGTEID
jgi:hypothetical protein